jgi:hypothetical protein
MCIAGGKDGATAEAVVRLIARECLVSRVIDKEQQILCGRLQFFIRCRLHRCGTLRNELRR